MSSLDKAALCGRIPHAGNMCLLARVEAWSEDRIVGSAESHRDADNPLRAQGRLAAICGVEYAAQLMAVHGSLIAPAGARPRMGFLASLRDIKLACARLDDIGEDLRIEARRLGGSAQSFIYDFDIKAGDRVLMTGRVAAMLAEGEWSARW